MCAAPSTAHLEITFDICESIINRGRIFFFFLPSHLDPKCLHVFFFYHRAKPDGLDGSVIPEEALQGLKDKQKKDISSNTFLNKAGNESSTKGFKNKAVWFYSHKFLTFFPPPAHIYISIFIYFLPTITLIWKKRKMFYMTKICIIRFHTWATPQTLI